MCAGRLARGDHQVEDGTGNADRAGGVLLLLHRQTDRHLDAGLSPALWTGAALAVTGFRHVERSPILVRIHLFYRAAVAKLDFTQNLREATDAITLGRHHPWLGRRRVFHYPPPTLLSGNFRLPCSIELQPFSLTPLKMRKVQLRLFIVAGRSPKHTDSRASRADRTGEYRQRQRVRDAGYANLKYRGRWHSTLPCHRRRISVCWLSQSSQRRPTP